VRAQGWGGPKIFKGEFIEGSFRAHQVPLPAANCDDEQLSALREWLESYNIHELIDPETGIPVEAIDKVVPDIMHKRLGMRKEAYKAYEPIDVPDWKPKAVEKGTQASSMKVTGELLYDVVKAYVNFPSVFANTLTKTNRNPKSFRIWSPDELESNKLDAVLRDSCRNFQWDSASRNKGGRVIEILSEHMCQGMLQGYTLTGRTGLFPSYESFIGIVATMCIQYAKFNKTARETKWHGDVGSLNYVETSTWTRQEHNGASHQNPSFMYVSLPIF
jgi:xylulose-5-phosphate/fructose-6-phosphate phosphoketolase